MSNRQVQTTRPASGGLPPEARDALARLLRDRGGSVAAGPARDALAAAGWVVPGSGQLDPGAALLFGCDVGGTKTQSVIADLSGRVMAEIKEPTAPDGGHAVIDQIATHRRMLAGRAGIDAARIGAAAIGMPAAVHPQTAALSRIPNIRGIEALDLPRLLSDRLNLPVVVENDVNLAAQGEHWLGHGAATMVFIALGTGIGMGIMVHDRLLRGARGAAGEISALPIGGDAFDPATHATGALESVVSSKALLAAYERRGGAAGRTLREAFAAPHDAAFAETLDDLARLLALAILSVSAVIDPEMIVLGGSIGSRPELLAALRGHLLRCMAPAPDCRISALGNRAGVIGAVWSARLALARQYQPS
ncbi:ROK family protein [Plastorhodobacter daqingensis]|uniref:ROK family protein n=1 Tax=Plastorhodobacter daqingensis TaxID=1387281 RepID=A0ABW2UMK2_9RHOB